MKDKQLLEGIISDYYNSIEDSFFCRRKNLWKSNATTIFFIISFLFFLGNIIPLFPAFTDDYLLWLFNKINTNFVIGIEEYSFWIKWALGTILSALIAGIAFIPFKYWDRIESKKFVKSSNLNFCYAFTLRKEVKSFLINENNSHLDNISEYFEKVNSHLVLTPFYYNNSESAKQIPLYELRDKILKKYDWIEFNKESNDLIDSFKSINSKVKKRIQEKSELEMVVPFIDDLTLYEFSFIKPNLKNQDEVELKDQRILYLKEMQEELKKLDVYEGTYETERTKKSKIKSILNFIANLYTSSNILVMFLSWLVSLTIIFVASSIIILKKVSIEIDSTILIGLLSAPFLGAITLTATIYSKNKK